MYKISVILPVYNAEDYLERSIKSVINQSLGFENIELILIDDKSSDDSRKIIQKYADKYENIIPIFLEKNSGWASVPRNEGIKKSTCDFIMFIDSDDEYRDDLCEVFYNTILSTDADIVSCDYYDCDSISITKVNFNVDIENSFKDGDKLIYEDETSIIFDNTLVWNKIFKKDIIIKNNIQFYEFVAEDLIFCIEYLVNVKKRVYLRDYYGYYKHIQDGSLVTQIDFESIKEKLEAFDYIYNLIASKTGINKGPYINNMFSKPIKWIIEETSKLKSFNESLESLRLLYDFETKISFDGYADNMIINFFNRLILKKQFHLTSILLKFVYYAKGSNFVRKFYRVVFGKN